MWRLGMFYIQENSAQNTLLDQGRQQQKCVGKSNSGKNSSNTATNKNNSNSNSSNNSRGHSRHHRHYVENYVAHGISLIQRAAQQYNNHNAILTLGILHYYSVVDKQGEMIIVRDYDRARDYFKQAIHYGSADALCWLGMMYENRLTTPRFSAALHKALEEYHPIKRNYTMRLLCERAAFRYYQRGYSMGDLNAYYYIARAYQWGIGTLENMGRFTAYLYWGVSVGHIKCKAIQASLYFEGRTRTRNLDKALYLIRQCPQENPYLVRQCETIQQIQSLLRRATQNTQSLFVSDNLDVLDDRLVLEHFSCRELTALYKLLSDYITEEINPYLFSEITQLGQQQQQQHQQHHCLVSFATHFHQHYHNVDENNDNAGGSNSKDNNNNSINITSSNSNVNVNRNEKINTGVCGDMITL
jgi:hypothetical protein